MKANYKKKLEEAQALYTAAKIINPKDTSFSGDLKAVIINATNNETYNKLESMGLVNPENIDGLLDYLHGEKQFGGMLLELSKVNKLIPAIEQHCKEKITE